MAQTRVAPEKELETGGWKRPALVVLAAVLGLGAAGFVLLNAERGPVSPSTKNPGGVDKAPPVEPLWPGVDVLTIGQVAATILFAATILGVIWGWRRYPRHPFLLMVIASNTLCWFDPINNWMIGLVYNPRMWHFPQDWRWVSMSPIIEPLTSFVYAPYILLPYFLAMPLLRRLQKNRDPDAYVWRHPLISLGVITFCVGFIWDAAQEIVLVSTQFLTYTHVVPFGSIYVGENKQFPLLMASGLITITMIPAAVLLYRDDTGRTQAEKVAQRFKIYAKRPTMATFLVMAVTLNVCFITFSSSFWLVRVTGAASSVACPWPYPASQVWDPHGLYEEQGHPGPFTAGAASGWLSGQLDGRPDNISQKSERCGAGS